MDTSALSSGQMSPAETFAGSRRPAGPKSHTKEFENLAAREGSPRPSHIQELCNVCRQIVNKEPSPTRQKCLDGPRTSRLCHECVTWATQDLHKSLLVALKIPAAPGQKSPGVSASWSPLGMPEHNAIHWLSRPLITHQKLQRNHFEH